jgi:hypothetical protein
MGSKLVPSTGGCLSFVWGTGFRSRFEEELSDEPLRLCDLAAGGGPGGGPGRGMPGSQFLEGDLLPERL